MPHFGDKALVTDYDVPFSSQGFGVHHALNPDPYRGVFGNDAAAYAADVADLISSATPGRVAGFFHETIQGVGGAVPLADGYLPLVYEVWSSACFARGFWPLCGPVCRCLLGLQADLQAGLPAQPLLC